MPKSNFGRVQQAILQFLVDKERPMTMREIMEALPDIPRRRIEETLGLSHIGVRIRVVDAHAESPLDGYGYTITETGRGALDKAKEG